MNRLDFYKLQASGNDFILIDRRLKGKIKNISYKKFAISQCRRKTGIGADGLLVVEPSKDNLFRMRIFNPDGSEAQMCGNGSRCCGLWAKKFLTSGKDRIIHFDTIAGKISCEFSGKDIVKVRLTDPVGLNTDISLDLNGRVMHAGFVNTGVPHAVIFVMDIESIGIDQIGSMVRRHKRFLPEGANVNFVQIDSPGRIHVRTYERGVEAETLSCGTGSVASAVLTACKLDLFSKDGLLKIEVISSAGERLNVYFNRTASGVDSVYLEGKAHFVYSGKLFYSEKQ